MRGFGGTWALMTGIKATKDNNKLESDPIRLERDGPWKNIAKFNIPSNVKGPIIVRVGTWGYL